MNTSFRFNENLKLISRGDKDIVNDMKKDLENLNIVSENITKIVENIFHTLNSENITQNLIKGKDYKLTESEVRFIKSD